MNLNDFSKWLQYNKEWKIEGGLNTSRTHCKYFNFIIFIQHFCEFCPGVLKTIYINIIILTGLTLSDENKIWIELDNDTNFALNWINIELTWAE